VFSFFPVLFISMRLFNISQTISNHFIKLPGLEYGHNQKTEEIIMNDKEFMVEKIRAQYIEETRSDLDQLKALDAKVHRSANVFAYSYGSISALIMGAGMSAVMTDIGSILGLGDVMVPGIIVGCVGMLMALTTYPIYKKILVSRKKKYGPEILRLSDELLK